jgi:hypothetical protein
MGKKIQTGVADFASIIDDGFAYVDKTKFIEILENKNPYISFFRPRRFGKSLFISTLKYYYDYKYADRFESLFGGTYICANPTPLRNSYSVLNFDFSGIKDSNSLSDIYDGFFNAVSSSIESFLISNCIKMEKSRDFYKSPAIMIDYFLKIVVFQLKHPLYILIDEYDHFLNAMLGAQTSGFKALVESGGFVRSFFEKIKSGAGNGLLKKIFMTGVCPITLDSLTSGFNITANMTLQPSLHDSMGFTSDEVGFLINEIRSNLSVDFDSIMEQMKKLYNGYRFCFDSKNRLFNSDMVLYYLQSCLESGKPSKKTIDPNILSDYSKLQSLVSIDLGDKNGDNYIQIDEAKNGRKEALISILTGEPMPVNITEVYELVKFDQNDFLSLLFYMGYLTISESEECLSLPNALIKRIFTDYFSEMSMAPTLGIDTKKNEEAMLQISSTGKNEKFVRLISDTLALTPDRLYMHFAETSVQLIGYSIAKNFTGYETEIEKDVGCGHVDLTFLPGIKTVKYYGLTEFKYIKAGELNPSKLALEDLDAHRLKLIKAKWDDAVSKLKKYSSVPQFADLLSQGRLKFWAVIFCTHRCLVNQEIDLNDKELHMELRDFGGWWFDSRPEGINAQASKKPE